MALIACAHPCQCSQMKTKAAAIVHFELEGTG